MLTEKKVKTNKLGSSTRNYILRYLEDELGWPASGTIIGSVVTFVIGVLIGIARCLKKRRLRDRTLNNLSRGNRLRPVKRDRVQREIMMAELQRNQPLLEV